MAAMEKVSTELKLAELKKDNIRKTLENLQSQSSSLFLLTLQWKDLQDHFESIQKSIGQHFKEVESKEKHLDSVRKRVEDRSKEVEWKENDLELYQKLIEDRSKEVELKENDVELIRKSMEKRTGEVELKEKHLNSDQNKVKERAEKVRLEDKRLDSIRKLINERSKEVELKEKQINSVLKSVEVGRKELELDKEDFEVFRRLVEEKSEEVSLKEKQLDSKRNSIEEKEKSLDLIKKSVEERVKEIELKEKQLDSIQNSFQEREKSLDLIQKSVKKRLKEVGLKDRELSLIQKLNEERCEELKMREMQIDAMRESVEKRSEKLDLKEKQFSSIQMSIKELSEELGLKEKQVNTVQMSFKELSEELGLKEKRLDTIQKLIEEGCKEVELKKEQLISIQKSKEKEIALIQESIEECSKELILKERQLDSIKKSITEDVKKLKLQEKQLDSIQLSIEERSKELESEERELNLIRKMINECLRELHLGEKQLVSIQKSIEGRLEELKLKENQVESIQKLFEERSKELELKEKQFISIQKSIEQCCKELKLKERKMVSIQKSLEECFNIIQSQEKSELLEALPVQNAMACSLSADLCITMDGESLQLFLNKHLNEHELIHNEVLTILRMSSDPAKLVLDAMQGFYPPHLKEGNVEFEATVIRRSCILLLEQLTSVSPQISSNVKEAAIKLAGEWRAKMRVETENSLEVLGFLQLVASYGLVSFFDTNDLLHLFGTVAQDRHASELCRALGFVDKIPVSGTLHSQVEIERLECIPVNNPIGSSSVNVRSFDTVDGRNMQLVHNDHMNEHNSIHNEVFATLRMSLDPAKLVLDAMQGIYPPYLEKGGTDSESSAIRSCILLLEQLMRIFPAIEPHVKEEAMKLAVEWKAKMRAETENSLGVFAFLWLLAAYGLVSAFNGDEILKLLQIVAKHSQTPDLCRALGFAEKIPDLIKLLVEKQQWFEAIRYIYAFELVDSFSPLPLLNAQLKFFKLVASEICTNGNYLCKKGNSLRVTLDEAAEKEVDALRAIVKCIVDQKLESEYSLEDLEKRIVQLEKQQRERRHIVPGPALKAPPQQHRGNKRPWTDLLAQAAPTTTIGSASAIHSTQPPSQQPAGLSVDPRARCLRTSALQYCLRSPITPCMNSSRGPHAPPAPAATPPVNTHMSSFCGPPVNPHTSSSAWRHGLGIASNGSARPFGVASTHFAVASTLGAAQYGLASSSGGNGSPPRYHPISNPNNTSSLNFTDSKS